LIGSVVIRSGAADRIGDILDCAVRHCFEVVEDAPEFAVSIPVRRAGTRAYQAVPARFGDRKRLKMDDAAVRTLAALTISPYAAAEALTTLGTEAMTRGIEPDELRYALSTLPSNRLVDLPPTAQSMLSALLGAEAPLSQTELADVASCSTSSVRRHMPTLTALGICAETDVGYRCVLAFSDERGLDDWEIEGLTPRAGLDAVLSTQLPPHRYADPDDDLAGALWYPPTPWRVLEDPPPELARWINVSRMLIDPLNSSKNAEIDFETVSQIDFGEPTAQQPVTSANDDWSARPDPNRTTEI